MSKNFISMNEFVLKNEQKERQKSIMKYGTMDSYDRAIKQFKDEPEALGRVLEELNILACLIQDRIGSVRNLMSLENYLHKQEYWTVDLVLTTSLF